MLTLTVNLDADRPPRFYLQLARGKVRETQSIGGENGGILADFDAAGQLLGLEVLRPDLLPIVPVAFRGRRWAGAGAAVGGPRRGVPPAAAVSREATVQPSPVPLVAVVAFVLALFAVAWATRLWIQPEPDQPLVMADAR